jgi:hypothetical protein
MLHACALHSIHIIYLIEGAMMKYVFSMFKKINDLSLYIYIYIKKRDYCPKGSTIYYFDEPNH